MRNKKNTVLEKVESIKHKDKRSNIPTEELRDFIADDERSPKAMLYPRDPSLDPQLVWKGKDEQDRQDLTVPVVPIYIQEKIHPQAIIDDLIAHAAASEKDGRVAEEAVEYQLQLFSDFNGGPKDFDQKVDFYQHQQNWSNRMILGDSLLVMTSLAEKEGLKGKVQTIYIDPPYGIKFGSNWQVSTRKRDVRDGRAEDATRQPEQIRAFRDTWELGIHSYLTYLRDRLVIARDLLTDAGSIFVQIGDENVHLVRNLLDEVFGSENCISQIGYRTNSPLGSTFLPSVRDNILWYAKNKELVKYRPLFIEKNSGEGTPFDRINLVNGERRRLNKEEREQSDVIPAGAKLYRLSTLSSAGYTPSCTFEYEYDSRKFRLNQGFSWKTTRDGLDRLKAAGRLEVTGTYLNYCQSFDDFPVQRLNNTWSDTFAEMDRTYVVQTAIKIIQRCILMTTDPGDLILDPTCGSGTTVFVAEQWGRRWITCDTSRVALALARTRLMSAKYPYYLLADSSEGMRKEAELIGRQSLEYKIEEFDVRKGFVCKRVPHVTLKSIANNPDIKEGMTRQQIDAAIARHADTEVLYDQPYEDSKRIRVSGPFTVESLSPHRVLSVADDNLDGAVSEQEARKQQDFTTMILDNLKKAGVQNRAKNERLKFDQLESYAGRWLHAAGTYTDSTGNTKRVAVSIGPEHGTVAPDQIKEAAKEAVQGIGFDLLIVCGFAFDPYVTEEAKRYGKLSVLITKMNPDLTMGDELLKKTGTGNLFMVFGEPDVEISKEGEYITVTVKGVDVYDPTTGDMRSNSTDEIACWFIDTEYNGESFFVRQAYFTGANDPYEKLKRALKAEIDETAWSSLYSTVSRPFLKPASGKIAIKVINHYGDEVLKVLVI